jgi:sugar/nucleoside kinase (ribokinase family)
VTAKLQTTLHLFDLIVGTEEEFHIAGGTTDTIGALRAVRAVSGATLVCKRGPMRAAAFTGPIPDTLDEGQAGPVMARKSNHNRLVPSNLGHFSSFAAASFVTAPVRHA